MLARLHPLAFSLMAAWATLLFVQSGFAQSQYRFQNYDASDGLAYDFVYTMAQDSLGFIWTQFPGALSRFDGYKFKVYKHDPNDSSRAALDFLQGPLSVDMSGNIWFREHHHPSGHPFKLARYNQKSDSFIKFLIDIDEYNPTRIGVDTDGFSVWLGTQGGGLFMSRVQLYRKVSGLTDISVNELIRKLRLQRAAQLLLQNWGPVSQVAYEVGFSNLSYFSKVFKEEFGVLPSEYTAKPI